MKYKSTAPKQKQVKASIQEALGKLAGDAELEAHGARDLEAAKAEEARSRDAVSRSGELKKA